MGITGRYRNVDGWLESPVRRGFRDCIAAEYLCPSESAAVDLAERCSPEEIAKEKPVKATKGKKEHKPSTSRDGSKKAVTLALLQRKDGATLA
jgi:hypothetical protein